MTDEEIITKIYKPLSEKINAMQKQLDSFVIGLNEKCTADIDYIAMEVGVDLDDPDSNE